MQDTQNEVKLTRRLERIPVVLIGLVVFVCPFAFLPFTYHATYVKYTIFQTALLLLLLCFVGGLLGLFPLAGVGVRRWGKDKTLAAVFAVLFLSVNALSVVWSDFPKATLVRVLELGFYIGWFLLGMVLLRQRRHIATLGKLYVAAAVITSAGAFLAYYLRDQLQFISPFQGRIGFPAGNPIFLAGYLLPALFISVFYAARCLLPRTFGAEPQSRSFPKALPMVLLAFFYAWTIYSTHSKSGYIGLVFACAAVLFFISARYGWALAFEFLAALALFVVLAGMAVYHFPDKRVSLPLVGALFVFLLLVLLQRQMRKTLPYFSFVFSAVVGAAYFFSVVRPALPHLFSDLVARGSTYEGGSTLAVRWVVFDGALRMIAAHPLLGWGTGTFVCNYPMFALPEQFIVNPFGTSALNVHSEPLQVAVEVGLVGLALAALMVWFISRGAWRGLKDGPVDESAVVGWGIFIGTLGMLVQELGSPGLRFWDYAPFVWTNLAILTALAPTREASSTPSESAAGEVLLPMLPRILALLIVAAILCKFWVVVALGDLLSQKYRKDAALVKQASWQAEEAEIQQRTLAELVPDHGLSGLGKSSAFLATALAGSRQSYLVAMRDLSDLTIAKSLGMENLLHAYYDKAIAFRLDSKFTEAAAVLEELQRESPNISDTRVVMGDDYRMAGNLPKAVVNYAVYRHQIPYDGHPRSNSARMALEAIIPRLRPEEAAAARTELTGILAKFRRDSAYSHIIIATLFEKEGRAESAASELEVVFNMGVREPEIFAKLAALWDQAGEPSRAQFWLNRARQMFPDDPRFRPVETAP